MSGKASRAFELQDGGQDIEVMTEDDFLRAIGGLPLADVFELIGRDVAIPAPRKPHPHRSIPIEMRPAPLNQKELKPPKPLRREWKPTDQLCAVEGCGEPAIFKTYKKLTYCDAHINAILRVGGLEPLESFTHPEDWRLTRCLTCGNVAHYRLVYTLDKNLWGEATCRACYWRGWAKSQRKLLGLYATGEPVSWEKAEAVAEEHNYIYLGPLSNPSLQYDPHRVECRRCGKISAERLGDIEFGCTCDRA